MHCHHFHNRNWHQSVAVTSIIYSTATYTISGESPIIHLLMFLGHPWCISPAKFKGCSDTFRSVPFLASKRCRPSRYMGPRGPGAQKSNSLGLSLSFTWIFLTVTSQSIGFRLFHPAKFSAIRLWCYLVSVCSILYHLKVWKMHFSCGRPWHKPFEPWQDHLWWCIRLRNLP